MLSKLKSTLPYFLFFLISLVVFLQPLDYNMDNLWNFSMMTAAFKGLLPYRDISMIQMPGWLYLSAPFLWIFGTDFITNRILNYLTVFAFTSLNYASFKRITNSGKKALAYSLIAFLLFAPKAVYGYTMITMLCISAASLIGISGKEKKYPILLGLLYGIPMVCKQSTGIVILLTHLVISFVFMVKDGEKKYWIKRMIASLMPITATLLFIFGFGLWKEFIDYTVKGLSSFSGNFNLNISANGFYAFLVLCIFGIQFLVSVCKKRFTNEEVMMGFISFSFVSNLYPLFDEHRVMWCIALVMPIVLIDFQKRKHPKLLKMQAFITKLNPMILLLIPFIQIFALISSSLMFQNQVMTTIVILVPTFFVLFTKDMCEKKRIYSVVKIITVFSFAVLQLFCFIKAEENELSMFTEKRAMLSSNSYYENIIMSNNINSLISFVNNKMDEYEKDGYSCYVVDQQEVLFSLERNRYVKHYDLLLNGNTGTKTAEDLFEQATEGKERVVFFLRVQEQRNSEQEYPGLHELIQERCTLTDDKVGTLYEVYEYLA